MPNEPERDIEKLLRRYAKKRRDDAGAPLEIHPATRRMLQGEVSRHAGKTSRAEKSWKFFGLFIASRGENFWSIPALRPRFAILLTALCILIAGSWLLLPPASPTKKIELAETRSGKELAKAEVPAPSAMPAQDKGIAYAARKDAAPAVAPATRPPLATPQPTPITADESVTRGAEKKLYRLAGKAEADRRREVVTTNGATVTTDTLALQSESSLALNQNQAATQIEASGNFNYRYANVATGEKASPVLANFQLEQAGNQLRVIDADGSTYTGAVEFADAPAAKTAPLEEKGAVVLAKKSKAPAESKDVAQATGGQQAQQVFFRVSGTNLTLNQSVWFAGNFVTPKGQVQNLQFQSVSGAAGAQNNFKQFDAKQQFIPLLQDTVISGRAQVGAEKEIEINAVQVGK